MRLSPNPYRIVGLGVLSLAMALVGCPGESLSLRVDLRTDMEPGVEFAEARLSLSRGEGVLHEERLAITDESVFFPAGPLWGASLDEPGTYVLELQLMDGAGLSVGRRRIVVRVTSASGVTASIFRSCAGVRCDEDEECCSGVCVPRPDEGDACGMGGPGGTPSGVVCTADEDCLPTSTCSTARCVEGLCFEFADPGVCPEGETCVPSLGACQPDDCVENWGNDCDDLTVGGGLPYRPVVTGDGDLAQDDIPEGSGGHSCAVLQGGLYCWGENRAHVLGPDESRPENHRPVRIGEASNWRRVTAGNEHACAINADGELYCWGHNHWGQLGMGDTAERFEPSLVAGGPWVDVDSSYYHTCAIERGGALYCWGINASNEAVGQSVSTEIRVLSPTRVERGAVFISVAVGQSHTCAVKDTNLVYCMGRNDKGQVGNRSGERVYRQLRQAWFQGRAISVSAGATNSCALTEDGRVYCWGSNTYNALGLNTMDTTVPGLVSLPDPVSQVDVGVFHSCVVGTQVACGGRNMEGQLGVGDNRDRGQHSPVDMTDVPTSFHHIAVGRFHTCARLPPISGSLEDQVFCWGKNNAGGIGQPPGEREDSPESVSFP